MDRLIELFKVHKLKIGIGVIIFIALILYMQFNAQQPVHEITAKENQNVKFKDNKNPEHFADANKQSVEKEIKVDIKGAVQYDGVYPAKNTDRIGDILKLAVPRKNADLDAVNLSLTLKDQMVIYIPFKGEVKDDKYQMYQQSNQSSSSSNNEQTVNINQASETELQNIPGIGPKKAADIIQYRETNGGFKTKEEIKEIRGIGDKTYISLEPYIEL